MNEDGSSTRGKLAALAAEMKAFAPDSEYYALTLSANRRNEINWSRLSHFVGLSPRGKNWELREASLVDPTNMVALWGDQGWVSVHNDAHLAVFVRIGGNALVAKELAQARLPSVLGPSECVHDGDYVDGGFGFLGTDHVDDKAAELGLAKGKLRMRVLQRDNYRCVICGRRASDHLDLELHVHHVIPREVGGPTFEENLVTLCGTCHKGLEPHYQPVLREIAGLPGPVDALDVTDTEFKADVARYRTLISEAMAKRKDSPQALHSHEAVAAPEM